MQQLWNPRRLAVGAGIVVTLAAVAVALSQGMFARAASPAFVTLAQSVAPEVAAAAQLSTLPASQTLNVTFTLRPRDPAALASFARDVATPGAPRYHRFLRPTQFAQLFGPDPAEVQRVAAFARQHGLRVTAVRSGGLFISASGTAAQVQAAFHVRLSTYRGANGDGFYANDRNLTLPANIASGIVSVTGLDSVARHRSHAVLPRAGSAAARRPANTSSCPPTVGTYALTPPQLATAYNFPTNATGSGQRLALVEFDGYDAGDVAAFAACFATGVTTAGVVQPRLVDLTSPLAPGAGAIEDELDIDVALGMAPGLAKIDVYEAPNTNAGVLDMLSAIANDYVDATVSDSWGSCESDTGFGVAASEEIAFLQMAAQGQGVYVAAGDAGAYDCLGDGGTPYHTQVVNADDPASDPYVTAVGGTTLTLNASTAAYMGEQVWNNSDPTVNDNVGGGGGFSDFWGSPTWQSGAKAFSTAGALANPASARVVPDVAADADPNSGYAMYCTVGAICSGAGWLDVGGTSAAAPLWAALGALSNQLAGGRVGLPTPALYQLYGADAGASGAAGVALGSATYYDYQKQVNGATPPAGGQIAFNDVTAGNNTFPATLGFLTGYSAQSGFDATSGLGTMNGAAVANYLAGAVRFTAPRLYMAAKGTNGGFWLSSYFLNSGDGTVLPNTPVATAWLTLGSQPFENAPAVADNGLTTVALSGPTALLWLAGVGTDGTLRFGAYNPARMSFGGWTAVPGATCQGTPAAAYVQQTFFVTCLTTGGDVDINAYNTVNGTWGGWAYLGGKATAPPTMASDGANLFVVYQTPASGGTATDWFTFYTVGPGTHTAWTPFATTCLQTPAVAYAGGETYALACIAGDTSTMWANTLAVSNVALSGWINLGAPAGLGFKNATAVAQDLLDSPGVTLYAGQGTNNASYVQVVTANSLFAGITGWQIASLPGIFGSNMAIDYLGA